MSPPAPATTMCMALLLVVAAGCGSRPAAEAEPPAPLLELASDVGLDFVHWNGMSGAYHFPEIVAAGGGFLDFDNDGDLDLYLLQGAPLDAGSSSAPLVPPPKGPLRDRLYRNDLDPSGDGPLRFVDVTAESRIDARGYGMGVVAGDYDNDGWIDLYVTNFGGNQLWRNQGPGSDGVITFADVTEETGTDDPRWSTSAAFLDFDADGWLDLFIVNYTDFEVSGTKRCVNEMGQPEFCGPKSFAPETDRLLRNDGRGTAGRVTFTDVSAAAGLLAAPGPGLGVVAADFDDDGRLDLYVANDQARNCLWLNRGDGGFGEAALVRGCALDGQGRAQASMGVDAGDVDGDSDLDLFMTHLLSEVNTLYRNDGAGQFSDRTAATGLGVPSLGFTGFGTALVDVDGDGWLDAVVANGEVRTVPEQRAAGDPFPTRQPNQLFLNDGAGTFRDASGRAPILAEAHTSRGVAVGDVDNDGDPDLLITNASGPAQLLLNRSDPPQWIGLRLIASAGRDALGAEVKVLISGQPIRRLRVRTDGSYLSSHDPRVLTALAATADPVIEVHWPGGRREMWTGLALNRYHTLHEGEAASPGEGSE